MEPPTNDGMTAMVKNTIPKPPIHCVNERQNSMPWGKPSTLSMTVAPVVVKPDIVSKKASVTWSMYPPMRNGSMPKAANAIHTIVTSR